MMMVSLALMGRLGHERRRILHRSVCRGVMAVSVLMSAWLFFVELPLLGHQLGVDPAGGNQFAMISGLDQAPVFQHDYPVGFDHAGKPVGNYERGPTLHQVVQGYLDHSLILGIDVRQGLV